MNTLLDYLPSFLLTRRTVGILYNLEQEFSSGLHPMNISLYTNFLPPFLLTGGALGILRNLAQGNIGVNGPTIISTVAALGGLSFFAKQHLKKDNDCVIKRSIGMDVFAMFLGSGFIFLPFEQNAGLITRAAEGVSLSMHFIVGTVGLATFWFNTVNTKQWHSYKKSNLVKETAHFFSLLKPIESRTRLDFYTPETYNTSRLNKLPSELIHEVNCYVKNNDDESIRLAAEAFLLGYETPDVQKKIKDLNDGKKKFSCWKGTAQSLSYPEKLYLAHMELLRTRKDSVFWPVLSGKFKHYRDYFNRSSFHEKLAEVLFESRRKKRHIKFIDVARAYCDSATNDDKDFLQTQIIDVKEQNDIPFVVRIINYIFGKKKSPLLEKLENMQEVVQQVENEVKKVSRN